MKLGAFDVCGAVAVGLFVAVVAAELPHLQRRAEEVELRPSSEESLAGFREGVGWYGLYATDDKVGFARIEQRRRGEGSSVHSSAVLNLEILGSEQRLETELEASLGPAFDLLRIRLTIRGGPFDIVVDGNVVDARLELRLEIGGMEHSTSFELEHVPTLDIGANRMILAEELEAGARVQLEVFDPMTMMPQPITVEYVGREELALIDGMVEAHHLRRYSGNTVVEVWVNELGEMLREELPFGLTAVRETEADATWGFTQESAGGARLQLDAEVLDEVSRNMAQIGARP